ncbi:hypothetical protein SAMN04488168_10210 [Bacillus sp. 491mf]|nr:hypothetical protein SAMN04488168_10210 [Bacillus sp. 491mf]
MWSEALFLLNRRKFFVYIVVFRAYEEFIFYHSINIIYRGINDLFLNIYMNEGAEMVRKNFKMFVPRYRTIAINGAVLDVNVSHDEFADEFLQWIVSKGWLFIGVTDEIMEEDVNKRFRDLLSDEEDKEE